MTGIIIITFNIHPDVFILQMRAIRKLCQDEKYQVEIIDNSTNAEAAISTRYHAELNKAGYTRIISATQDASQSHAFAANFAFAAFKDKYDRFAFFDHDLIPVKPFSVSEILNGKLMAGLAQDKEQKYFWPGCFMFNSLEINHSLINFSPSPGLDTGGQLWKALKEYGPDNCIFFDECHHQNPHFPDGQYNFFSMLHNETFMHFINASNWNPVEFQQERLNSLINIARQKIADLN